ncbi:MAG TPA: hypothetical protein VGM03_18965, partial [Phycisphaerae bacterium]
MKSAIEPSVDAHCPSCGYNLRGLITRRCPECGFHYDLPAVRMLAISDAVRQSDAAANMLTWSLIASALALPAILVRFGLGFGVSLALMIAASAVVLFVLYRYTGFELPFTMPARYVWVPVLALFALLRWIVVFPVIGTALASGALGKIVIDGLFTQRGWPYGERNLEPRDRRALRRLTGTAWISLLVAFLAVSA